MADENLTWAEHLCQNMGLNLSPKNIGLAAQFLDKYQVQLDKDSAWRKVVQDELVNLHILSEINEDNPHKALSDIIEWNQKIALDPAVSAEARALAKSEERPTTLVKLSGRVMGNYEKAHYVLFFNPAKVDVIQQYREYVHILSGGKWFEVPGNACEIANCLGLVKNLKEE